MSKTTAIRWNRRTINPSRGCMLVTTEPIRNYADGSPTRLCPACRAKQGEPKTGSLEAKSNG